MRGTAKKRLTQEAERFIKDHRVAQFSNAFIAAKYLTRRDRLDAQEFNELLEKNNEYTRG